MSKDGSQRFFTPLPWELFEAWQVDSRVKGIHVLSAYYVASRCFEARNTGGGVASVELSTLARLCGVKPETIRRKLHDLRTWGWIDFQAGDGGDPAWRIWLTGLALEQASPRPLHDLSTRTPLPAGRGLSTGSRSQQGTNPHRQTQRASTTSPPSASDAADKRDDTRRQEKKIENRATEEKLDHFLGETTAPMLGGDGSFLSDEAMSELGTLPIAELHRRHERGEL